MTLSYSMMWMDIIVLLSDTDTATITGISRDLAASYTHVFNIVKELESKNILTITKNGRDNILKLTSKGVKIVYHLRELEKLMEE